MRKQLKVKVPRSRKKHKTVLKNLLERIREHDMVDRSTFNRIDTLDDLSDLLIEAEGLLIDIRQTHQLAQAWVDRCPDADWENELP